MLICADPTTDPELQTLADELGVETAMRFESDIFVVTPIESEIEAEELRQSFARAAAALDYHLPEPGVTSSHANTADWVE